MCAWARLVHGLRVSQWVKQLLGSLRPCQPRFLRCPICGSLTQSLSALGSISATEGGQLGDEGVVGRKVADEPRCSEEDVYELRWKKR